MVSEKKNRAGIFIISVVAVVFIAAIIYGVGLLSYRSTVVNLSNQIQAQTTANKSNYDNMWKKFKEMTQVTEIQAADFKDVYDGMITGRYAGDSGLLLKMVQESNPTLNQQVYSDLQREIASSRDMFDNNQKRLIDIVREYNTTIQSNGGLIYNSLLGYQLVDADSLIVTSGQTKDAFSSGEADEINLKSK